MSLLHVTFSPDIEAFYLTVTENQVAKTIDITDLIAADLDATGALVGVEFVMRPEELTEDMYRLVADRFPALRRDNERAAVAERVIAAMRSPEGRRRLSSPTADGAVEVAIALRSDTVNDAARWVAALGSHATVVVPLAKAGLVPLVWTISEALEAALIPADSNVHPESTLGMVVDYLEASGAAEGEGGFSFRITVGEAEAEITESGPLLALA